MDPRADQGRSADGASWAAIAVLVVAIIVAELRQPMGIAVAGLTNLLLACVALGAASIFYRRLRPNEKLAASCSGLVQALVYSAAGSILSYLLARDGGALWDPTLSAWDSALGLDWLGYVRFVDAHSWLVLPYRLAYASLIPQIVVLILLLGFSGRLDTLRTFILAAILSGTIAIFASPFFPAVGNFAFRELHPGDFAHVWQWSQLADVRDFLAVRSGRMTVLDLRSMQGIIVFPSYHGALAAVSLWAFRKSGLRAFRWVGMLVAATTLAATPVDGGHYFMDLLAGIAIAAASIVAASRLVFVRLPLPAIRALPFRRSREAFAR